MGVNNFTNRKYAEYGVLDFLGRPNYYPSARAEFLWRDLLYILGPML